MKKIFRYVFAALAGAVLLAGCETDNNHAKYTGPNGVAFNAATYSIQVPAADNTFLVPIHRGSADGALTVSLSSTRPKDANYPDDMFSFPANVTFAAGEIATDISVGVKTSYMAPGANYTVPLTASDASVTSGTPTTTVSIRCGVIPNWIDAGEGTYTFLPDWFFEGTTRLTLQQAEGSSFYRLPIYDENTPLQFSVAEDGTINMASQAAGFTYSTYGAVSVVANNGKSKRVGKEFNFYVTYNVSAGSFGEVEDPGEKFVLD